MGMVETADEPSKMAGSHWDEIGRDLEDARASCPLPLGSRR